MAKVSEIEIPSLLFAEQASAPSTPASGFGRLYIKSDGVYFIGDDGTEVGPLGSGEASAAAFVGARVYHDAAQSIASSTDTALAFNTERYDTDGFHDTGTNNSRLTIPSGKAGKYLITGHLEYANVAASNYRDATIRLNGSTYIASQRATADSTSATEVVSIATVYDLAVADYVELVARQNTGSALNVNSTGNYSPEFSISKIG